MISKSLPAVLQQALENHVNESQLTHDDELQGIYDRLTNWSWGHSAQVQCRRACEPVRRQRTS